MENNTKKYARITLLIIAFSLINNITNGQQFLTDSLQSFKDAYKSMFLAIGTNFSTLSSQTNTKYNSGMGFFIHLEEEINISQMTSLNGQIGGAFLTSTADNGVHTPIIFGPQALLGIKFRINNSISLLYGASTMYFFFTEAKSKLNESYHKIEYFNKFQPGVYAGIDLYLKDWMNMRIYAQNYTNNFTINIAFVFPKDIFQKKH